MARRDAAPAWAALVISDLHLNRGPVLSNGKPNTLEDFRSDQRFARMLEAFARRYPAATKLTLILNGDTVDFMAIPDEDGRYQAVPTLEGAVCKFDQAWDGHPVFFASLARFLADRPGAELLIVIGNHDQDFAWPELQARIKELLAARGADPARIRFVREVEYPDGVVVIHGAEFDDLNRVPPDEQMFITDKVADWKLYLAAAVAIVAFLQGVRPISELAFGWKRWSAGNVLMAMLAFLPWLLMINWAWSKIYFKWFAKDHRILNLPYGYYMNSGLAMAVKRRFLPWIGRMQDHGPIWVLTLARDWHFALAIVPMLIMHMLYYMSFVRMLSVRFKASLGAMIGNLAATMHADRVEDEVAKFVRDRPGVKRIIYGHTHAAGVQTVAVDGRDIAIQNTGTGVEQIRMETPKVMSRTGWGLESFLRRVGYHWRHAPRAAAFFTLVHLAAYAAVQAVLVLTGWSPDWWNPWLAAVAGYLLLMRQAYAEYRGKAFTEYTPCEIRGYAENDVETELFRFDADGQFVPFLDPK